MNQLNKESRNFSNMSNGMRKKTEMDRIFEARKKARATAERIMLKSNLTKKDYEKIKKSGY